MKVLVLSGRKQSGKDTLGNFLLANRKELFGPAATVRKFGFAEPLKDMVSDLFDVPREWVYGTDEDKNRETSVHWKDLPIHVETILRPRRYMTVRELLQQFGTNIVRQMHPNAWVNALERRIENSGVDIAVIADARFPNEILGAKSWGAKVVRLRRNEDLLAEHESEWALDQKYFDWGEFDAVIDNRNMGLQLQSGALVKLLHDWGWFYKGIAG